MTSLWRPQRVHAGRLAGVAQERPAKCSPHSRWATQYWWERERMRAGERRAMMRDLVGEMTGWRPRSGGPVIPTLSGSRSRLDPLAASLIKCGPGWVDSRVWEP